VDLPEDLFQAFFEELPCRSTTAVTIWIGNQLLAFGGNWSG
jgi:hypothetical protein